MENEDERDEYVLNENGYVFKDSVYYPLAWYYAQFQDECYEVSLASRGRLLLWTENKFPIGQARLGNDAS